MIACWSFSTRVGLTPCVGRPRRVSSCLSRLHSCQRCRWRPKGTATDAFINNINPLVSGKLKPCAEPSPHLEQRPLPVPPEDARRISYRATCRGATSTAEDICELSPALCSQRGTQERVTAGFRIWWESVQYVPGQHHITMVALHHRRGRLSELVWNPRRLVS